MTMGTLSATTSSPAMSGSPWVSALQPQLQQWVRLGLHTTPLLSSAAETLASRELVLPGQEVSNALVRPWPWVHGLVPIPGGLPAVWLQTRSLVMWTCRWTVATAARVGVRGACGLVMARACFRS